MDKCEFVGAWKKEDAKKTMYRVNNFLFVRDIFIGWIGFPGHEVERSLAFSQRSANIHGVIDG